MIKLFCAVPTMGAVADSQTYFWREAERLYKDKIELIWPAQCVRRFGHDYARNELVKEFLKSDADILFFLDSDVVPPNDLFDIVLEHSKWKLAGAAYPVFMTPAGADRPQLVFTAYKGTSANGLGVANVPQVGKEFIDGLATGCLFIKREILEALEEPYFSFKHDEKSRQMIEGEDLSFCRRMGSLGHKFYIDYSKTCKHYKNLCLLDMNNYAIEYAKRSVEQYAAIMKPLVEELSARLRAKKEPTIQAPPSKLEQLRKSLRA